MKLTLPLGPSVNQCYRGYLKRVKTDVYKNWLSEAGKIIRVHGYKISDTEWLEARIIVFLPLFYKNKKKKKQDLDNFIKPLLDCLGVNIPGFKDEYVKIIKASKQDSDRNEMEIEIKEIIIN